MALAQLRVMGYVSGIIYLVSRLTLARSFAALARPAAVLVALMLLLTLFSQN